MRQVYSEILKGKKVTLLKGGPGKEREVSLRSATAVAKALHICGAEVHEIDVTGPAFHLPEGTELAFNIIHGTFGEDGQLQEILSHLGVPYTGEGINGSRIAFDKIRTKECFDRAGVPTSTWHSLREGESPRCGEGSATGIQCRSSYRPQARGLKSSVGGLLQIWG